MDAHGSLSAVKSGVMGFSIACAGQGRRDILYKEDEETLCDLVFAFGAFQGHAQAVRRLNSGALARTIK
jgi:hypothetical protein